MSTIDLTKADSVGYVPDTSSVTYDPEKATIFRHFKGGYYIIAGFLFDAELDRWKYGYLDAYFFRDMWLGKVETTEPVPFARTPENFHELIPNNSPHDLEMNRGVTHVPRFLVAPFTLKTLPDNQTLFD